MIPAVAVAEPECIITQQNALSLPGDLVERDDDVGVGDVEREPERGAGEPADFRIALEGLGVIDRTPAVERGGIVLLGVIQFARFPVARTGVQRILGPLVRRRSLGLDGHQAAALMDARGGIPP